MEKKDLLFGALFLAVFLGSLNCAVSEDDGDEDDAVIIGEEKKKDDLVRPGLVTCYTAAIYAYLTVVISPFILRIVYAVPYILVLLFRCLWS